MNLTFKWICRGCLLAFALGTLLNAQAPFTITTVFPSVNPPTGNGVFGPTGIVADGSGNVYFADPLSNRVFKYVLYGGPLTIFAGTGVAGYDGDSIQATAAELNAPSQVGVDAGGNVYILDQGNFRIRKVSPSGRITTVVGNGMQGPAYVYGTPAANASLGTSLSMTVDGVGNIFFGDPLFGVFLVQPTAGILYLYMSQTTSGAALQPAAVALNSAGLVVSGQSGIYESRDGNTVSTLVSSSNPPPTNLATNPALGVCYTMSQLQINCASQPGQSTVFAGISGLSGFTGDGGPATSALFTSVQGLAFDPTGNLLISDTGNDRIRIVTGNGIINSLLAGLPGAADGIAFDRNGNLYVADEMSNVIWRGKPGGEFSIIAGTGQAGETGDGLLATESAIYGPQGIAVSADGTVYFSEFVTEAVRYIDSQGILRTLAGGNGGGYTGDGPAKNARLLNPSGLAIDASGDIFIADTYNDVIREVTPDGIIHTVAGHAPSVQGGSTVVSAGDGEPATLAFLNKPGSLAIGPSGNVVVEDETGELWSFYPGGPISLVSSAICRSYPLCGHTGLTIDGANNIFRIDSSSVVRIDPNGNVSTVAGTGTQGLSGDNGPATSAELGVTSSIALDRSNNIFIGDAHVVGEFPNFSGRVREVFAGPRCSLALSLANQTIDSETFQGSLGVTTDSACGYTATATSSWLHVTSGANGTGQGTVQYSVDANSAQAPRTGSIEVSVAGATSTLNIYQWASTCQFSANPTQNLAGTWPGVVPIQVQTTPNGCANWHLTSQVPWLIPTSPLVNGNTYVAYNNPTSQSRQGTITLGGPGVASQVITVTQAASPVMITSPTPGSAIFPSTTFNWTIGGAEEFQYRLGSTPGGNDVAAGFTSTGSVTISNVPFGNVYFSLLYESDGEWQTLPVTANYVVLGPPTQLSASPNAGSGTSQVFAFSFLDALGTADLQAMRILINSSLAGSNACYLYYSAGNGVLYLLSDAGAFQSGITIGTAGTLSNSQCSINVGGASAASPANAPGGTLVLTIPITFSGSFAGAKNIYLEEQGAAISVGPWVQAGSWTVPVSAAPPAPVSVSPSSGSGASQTFIATFSDGAGAADITAARILINSSLSGTSACFLYYVGGSQLLYLLSDAGAFQTPITIGTLGTLSNSQCSLNVGASSAVLSGNTLTLNLAVTFTPAFAGPKNVFLEAQNAEVLSAWAQLGAWTAVGVVTPPAPVSVTPSSGSGFLQTFTAVFSDPAGASDILAARVLINSSFSGTNACFIYYTASGNMLYLLSDAGALQTGVPAGTSGSLSNSQCSVSPGASSVVASGNTLTLTVVVNFLPAFQGQKSIFLEAQNATALGGWSLMGSWTATAVSLPMPISVTPNSGSGLSQTFTAVFSDTAGGADIIATRVSIDVGPVSANSCFLYYYKGGGSDTLYLLTDSGALSSGLPLGSSGTLSNSQCSVNLASSSAVVAANSLTLTLAMTFSPSFDGAKKIFLEAQSATVLGGFEQLGTWNVGGSTPPSPGTVNPSSGNGSSQTFTATYSDPAGAADIAVARVLINSSFSGTNACFIYFNQSASDTLYLLSDAGAFQSGIPIGSAGTLSNSQCSVNVGASSASLLGNALTLNLAITFTPAFVGAKDVFLEAQSSTLVGAWAQGGTWTVP